MTLDFQTHENINCCVSLHSLIKLEFLHSINLYILLLYCLNWFDHAGVYEMSSLKQSNEFTHNRPSHDNFLH